MNESKKSPDQFLKLLQKLNPNATPDQLKELMFDEMQKDPDRFGKQILEDLFSKFEQEIGHQRSDANQALAQFTDWLNKPKQ